MGKEKLIMKFHSNGSMMLWLMICYLHISIGYGTNKEGCVQPSCMKTDFASACLFCKTNHAELLHIKHLTLPKIADAIDDYEYSSIWIQTGPGCPEDNTTKPENCKIVVKNGLNNSSCLLQSHFMCYKNDSSCVNCSTPAPVPATHTTTMTERTSSAIKITPKFTSTITVPSRSEGEGANKVLISMVFLGVFLCIAVVVGVSCFVYKRSHSKKDRVDVITMYERPKQDLETERGDTQQNPVSDRKLSDSDDRSDIFESP